MIQIRDIPIFSPPNWDHIKSSKHQFGASDFERLPAGAIPETPNPSQTLSLIMSARHSFRTTERWSNNLSLSIKSWTKTTAEIHKSWLHQPWISCFFKKWWIYKVSTNKIWSTSQRKRGWKRWSFERWRCLGRVILFRGFDFSHLGTFMDFEVRSWADRKSKRKNDGRKRDIIDTVDGSEILHHLGCIKPGKIVG